MADVAQLGIAIESDAVTAAVVALDRLDDAATRADVAVTGLAPTARTTGTALTNVAQTAVVAQKETREFGKVVEISGKQAEIAARRTQEMNAAFKALRPAASAAAADIDAVAKAGRGFDIRGVSMQLSQVGQMAMVTGNPIQALAIQLPDLGLAFGTVGAAAGLAAGLMLPIGAAMLGIGDDAEEAEESVDAFAAALSSVQKYADIAKRPLAELRDEFHQFAEDVRQDARDMMEISARQVARTVAGPASAGNRALDPGRAAIEEYRDALRDIYNNAATQGGKLSLSDILGLREARADLAAILEPLGLTLTEVERMDRAFVSLGQSGDQSLEVVLERMTAARDAMKDAYAGVGMPDDVFEDFTRLEGEIESLRAVIADTADVTRAELVESLGNAWTKAGDFAKEVLSGANNVGILNDSTLSGIWSRFDGLIDRARTFLGLTGEINGSMAGGGAGEFASVRGTPSGDYQRDLVSATAQLAQKLGLATEDILAVLSYETKGTFNPAEPGPITKWGQHIGLYQAGGPQREQYGYDPNSNNAFEHIASLERYLAGSGFRAGMTREDLYSTINAGGPGRWNASDFAAGGDPNNRTVGAKVGHIFSPNSGHRGNAAELMALYGGQAEYDAEFIGGIRNTLAGARNPGLPAGMGAPPTRGMDWERPWTGPNPLMRPEDADFGLVGLPSGMARPRNRPALLTEGHEQAEIDKTRELTDAVNTLIGTYDEMADIAQQVAQAREDINEAVEAGIYTEQEGAVILEQYTQHLYSTSEAAQELAERSEEAAQKLQDSWREGADQIGGALADIIVRGRGFRETIGGLFADIAADILQSGVSNAIMEAFSPMGGAEGGGLGAIGNAIIGAFTGGGTGRTAGGQLRPRARPFAGGGDTGYGPRSGGLDGQGGFLAMLHPQETVIDHARGGTTKGGDTLIFDFSGVQGDDALFAKVQAMIQQNLLAQNRKMPDQVQYISKDRRAR